MKQDPNNDPELRKEPNSKMISFRLPIGYIRLLQQLACQTGKSKSKILREGLELFNQMQK